MSRNEELNKWKEELSSHHLNSEATYTALFTLDGELIFANNAMKSLFIGNPQKSLINPSFDKIISLDSEDPKIFEGVLTLGNLKKFFSINAKIFKKENQILIIGEVNPKELLIQNETILQLNRKISNLQRKLIKEKSLLKKTVEELQESIEKVKQLTGLLPICSACKKIRDDKGYWQAVEKYLMDHTDAKLTHSVCPDCAYTLYPEFMEKKKRQAENT